MMTAGTVAGVAIGGVLLVNLLSALGRGDKKESKEPTQQKPKEQSKKKSTTAKECYGDACKQVHELRGTLKKMRKQAKTPQELKLVTNLEGKILDLV